MQLSSKLHTELRRFSHILLRTDQPENIISSYLSSGVMSDGYALISIKVVLSDYVYSLVPGKMCYQFNF
jgi:hypothetical protein